MHWCAELPRICMMHISEFKCFSPVEPGVPEPSLNHLNLLILTPRISWLEEEEEWGTIIYESLTDFPHFRAEEGRANLFVWTQTKGVFQFQFLQGGFSFSSEADSAAPHLQPKVRKIWKKGVFLCEMETSAGNVQKNSLAKLSVLPSHTWEGEGRRKCPERKSRPFEKGVQQRPRKRFSVVTAMVGLNSHLNPEWFQLLCNAERFGETFSQQPEAWERMTL